MNHAAGENRGDNLRVSNRSEGLEGADCVEKLRILDAAIFRKEPLMPKSQMRSVMRRSEMAHERQKTNLAEPLVSKSWLRCTDKNFADFAKNGVFQHNQPKILIFCLIAKVCYRKLKNGLRGERSEPAFRRTKLCRRTVSQKQTLLCGSAAMFFKTIQLYRAIA